MSGMRSGELSGWLTTILQFTIRRCFNIMAERQGCQDTVSVTAVSVAAFK